MARSRGTVQLLAFSEGGGNDEGGLVGEAANVGLGDDDDVFGNAKAGQGAVEALGRTAAVGAVGHDDEDIEIAVQARIATGR